MSAREMAQFGSEEQARDAYFSETGDPETDPGAEPDPGTGWAEPEDIDVLEGNWYLLRQEQIEGDQDRYFVLVGPDPDRTLAMQRGGGTVEVTEQDTFDDLPSMDTEDEAQQAHALWLEEWDGTTEQDPPERNEPTEDADGNQWTEWELIEEVPPWYVLARTREDGEAFEIVIAGTHLEGHEIYLHPDGEIDTDPYIYTDFDRVESALVAYFDGVESGDIPEDERPTGGRPDDDTVARDAGLPGGGSGTPSQRAAGPGRLLGRIVRFGLRNPKIVIAVLAVVLLVWRHRSPADNPLDTALGRLRGIGGGANVSA